LVHVQQPRSFPGMSSGDLSGEAGSFVAPAGWDNSSGSPTGARKPPDTGASWGHWRGDGISSAGGDFPRPTSPLRESRRPTSPRPSSPASSMMSGASPASQRPSSMSPLDGAGYDRTAGCPPKEQGKVWSRRSMTKMSDYGTIPAALPLGLTDSEKKLWCTSLPSLSIPLRLPPRATACVCFTRGLVQGCSRVPSLPCVRSGLVRQGTRSDQRGYRGSFGSRCGAPGHHSGYRQGLHRIPLCTQMAKVNHDGHGHASGLQVIRCLLLNAGFYGLQS